LTGTSASVPVLLGLGANLGDPLAQLEAAVERLGGSVSGLRCSSVYRTEPVGLRDQPDFYNLVCAGFTELDAEALLRVALEAEAGQGRVRGIRNGPRTIDIDLLDHGGQVRESESLVLPHPRLHERAFVLVPLAELAPEWRHPVLGLTPAQLLAAARPLERVELAVARSASPLSFGERFDPSRLPDDGGEADPELEGRGASDDESGRDRAGGGGVGEL
jgi:2-amino-4-hydroxy-6-hydroxymethyldihydropteridine diphosphokinase